MDSWFSELFEILSRQTESTKVDRFMPKLYDEFDVLTRAKDKEELHEIYQFVRIDNPVKTNDSSYNDKTHQDLKKEVIQRLLLLGDFTMLELDMQELLDEDNTKKIDEYLKAWKSKSIVYNHLKDFIDANRKPEPVFKTNKTIIEPEESEDDFFFPEPKPIKKQVVETEEIKTPIPTPKQEKVEPEPEVKEVIQPEQTTKIEPKAPLIKEPEIKKTDTVEVTKSEPKPEKVVEKAKPEPKIEKKPEPKAETPKKEIKEPTKKAEPIKTLVPEVKEAVIKPDFRKKTEDFVLEAGKEYSFMDFVTLMSDRYPIRINTEILAAMTAPHQTYYRALIDFIDSEARDATFFIDMMRFIKKFDQQKLIDFIVDRSWALKNLTNFNIAVINEPEADLRTELMSMLGDEVGEHIILSRHEHKLRKYVEEHFHPDETSETLKMHAYKAAVTAPSLGEHGTASDAIDYFVNNVIATKHQLIDIRNMAHVYWSMILAATIAVYVKRSHVSDYTESMDWISGAALLLAEKIEDSDIRTAIRTLATSYVTRIYRLGGKSDDYDDWWARQKDDLRESKNDNITSINSIR